MCVLKLMGTIKLAKHERVVPWPLACSAGRICQSLTRLPRGLCCGPFNGWALCVPRRQKVRSQQPVAVWTPSPRTSSLCPSSRHHLSVDSGFRGHVEQNPLPIPKGGLPHTPYPDLGFLGELWPSLRNTVQIQGTQALASSLLPTPPTVNSLWWESVLSMGSGFPACWLCALGKSLSLSEPLIACL